jgi:hypothetical protein
MMKEYTEQIAKELLDVLMTSQSHNPAWALKEILEKLRELMTGSAFDLEDEQGMMYEFGWTDCLKEIDEICNELEVL